MESAVWIIRIWEPEPPAGCEPVEWLLLTNHPVETVADMRRVKTWYEWRWVVEEDHKAQKTGRRKMPANAVKPAG